MKKTISLDKEHYLFLVDLLLEIKSDLKSDSDVSSYHGDLPDWLVEQRDRALEKLPLLNSLFDSVLFGE